MVEIPKTLSVALSYKKKEGESGHVRRHDYDNSPICEVYKGINVDLLFMRKEQHVNLAT